MTQDNAENEDMITLFVARMLQEAERDPKIFILQNEADRLARAALASLQDRRPKLVAELDEPKSYADWQQRRGMAMDTIDWIIAEYDGFMQDDHYDPYGFMERLFTKLRTKRQALESKTHG